MSYTRTTLKTSVANMVSGEIPTTQLDEICNRAVREIASRVDLRSSIRSTSLAPNLIQQQYEYQCPSDLKGISIIDIKPQIGRGRFYKWTLTTPEEFDRTKADLIRDNFDARTRQSDLYYGERNDGKIAFEESDMIRKLLVSRLTDSPTIIINSMEDEDEWDEVGDTDAITIDSDNYITGEASLGYNIDSTGGTTAGVESDKIEFDIDKYLNNGSLYVWAYISTVDDITNFKLRIGLDGSNYYEMTSDKNNEGNSIAAGWNLMRFDMSGKTTTGTIASTDMEYVSIFMTKDAGKTDESGFLFNNLSIGIGKFHRVIYYSKYLWKNAAGARIENSTNDTDALMADTDEIRLIEKKAAALGEKYLKNHNEASLYEQEYNDAEAQYQIFHTSQALIMVKEYYDYGNIQ